MKVTYQTLIAFIFISFFALSCSDEPCEGVICPNGFSQVMNDDRCDCISDGTANPCEGVVCPEGFTAVISGENCNCVDSNSENNTIVPKAGFVNTDETWTADKIYLITGKVVVPEGRILTIEPGTIIKATQGTGSLASALIVARGGKINACGTADAPIVMTSELDNIEIGQTEGSNLDITQNALWGGLIILGNAPGSFEGDVTEFQIEGIPADDTFGLYGGDNAIDDSGSLCYISIRHGGASIGENNEINGLTLGCVGSGTFIDNIEVVANLDDGIEFFGGTVNVTNALVWGQGDDAYDVDQAYAGTLDNFVYIAGPDSDHALEIDGPEGSAKGRFTFINGTMKGLNAELADFRKGAMGSLLNSSFFNFDSNGDLEIDDAESSSNFFAGELVISGLEFVDSRSVGDICNDKSDGGNDVLFDEQMELDNTSVNTLSRGASTSTFSWTYAFSKSALDF